MRKRFKISEMHCAACQSSIEKLLKELQGVKQYKVNLLKAYASRPSGQTSETRSEISQWLSQERSYGQAPRTWQGRR